MARMWPIDGVIGENGGLFIRRDGNHGVIRRYWHDEVGHSQIADRLTKIGKHVQDTLPFARFADDQPFRLTSIAFSRPENADDRQSIIATLRAAGADTAANNLWILGWLGGYDKLAMVRRVMAETYGIDVDAEEDAVRYTGDSTNDAPMFGFFRHTVGVSRVRRYLSEIPIPPSWITKGPGGDGFVEAAEAVLRTRHNP